MILVLEKSWYWWSEEQSVTQIYTRYKDEGNNLFQASYDTMDAVPSCCHDGTELNLERVTFSVTCRRIEDMCTSQGGFWRGWEIINRTLPPHQANVNKLCFLNLIYFLNKTFWYLLILHKSWNIVNVNEIDIFLLEFFNF